MKAIIDNKLYDTDTAEFLFEFLRENQYRYFQLTYYTEKLNIKIYKTKKGAYFEVENDKKINLITERCFKKILMDLNPDKYIELFEDVEEA